MEMYNEAISNSGSTHEGQDSYDCDIVLSSKKYSTQNCQIDKRRKVLVNPISRPWW